MATSKTNNPEGINQYTKRGALQKVKERLKSGWEAVDKTVKYGAAGAAIGAGYTGLSGVAGTQLKALSKEQFGNFLKKVGRNYAIAGGVAGTVTGAGQISATDLPKGKKAALALGQGAVTGATMAGAGVVSTIASKALAAPTPAKMAAGAVVGGLVGAVVGFREDRKEARKRKSAIEFEKAYQQRLNKSSSPAKSTPKPKAVAK